MAARLELTGNDEMGARCNNMKRGPRYLESIAIAEDAIEKREHAKYMQSTQALSTATVAAQVQEAKKTKSHELYYEKSDTLSQ